MDTVILADDLPRQAYLVAYLYGGAKLVPAHVIERMRQRSAKRCMKGAPLKDAYVNGDS